MSQKVLYLIIGLLSGLLIMEWVVRPADSQTTTVDVQTVKARQIALVDAAGNITALLFNGNQGPILGVGRSGEPSVSIGADAGTALISVSGNSTNKTLIGATTSNSSVTTGGLTVENSVNRGHAVRLSATTLGGRVITYKNFAITGRLPGTAGKLVAGSTATWGQVKASEPAEDEPAFESAGADNAEFGSPWREYEARLEALNQR